jgi:hypothetical protein
MPNGMNVRVLGIGECLANLRTLDEALQNKIVRLAALAAGRVFLQQIQSTTYSANRRRRTGLLLAAQGMSAKVTSGEVSVWVSMHGTDVAGEAPGFSGGRPRLQAFMPSNTKARHTPFYWWFLEKGTKERVTKTTHARRGFVSSRQWVEPAFDAKGDSAIAAFADTVARELEKVCATLPQGARGIPL